MVIENVDPNETESAASEAEILNRIGVLVNGAEPYKRLQKNPSGLCLECKAQIAKERLELFPNCNHCAKCQGEIDKKTGRSAPYRNTVPIDKIEDEESDDEKIKESNINSAEDLPADLNHALKVYKRDSKGDSED
jgi:RNA polymerase-binding transcription factor DksA